MRRFLQLITRYPLATALAVILLALFGVYSARHMPVDLFPDLQIPVVNIVSHYPGAASADMERLVSRPIEDEMRTIPDVKRVASTSVQGLSQVTVEFSWGTRVRDARQLVVARLARLRNVLPRDVVPRLENIGTTLQEVSGYVFYGAADPITLRNTIRHDIAGRLMGVTGVSSVEVLGGDRRAFVVVLHPEAMTRLGITTTDVIAALQQHNVSTVAGFVQESGREYLVRGDARFKTIADILAVPVVRAGSHSVLLQAVADVYDGRAPRHYTVLGNGVPAVALIVRKQPGTSTIAVVENVDRMLARLTPLLPGKVVVKKFYDQSEIILESRQEIVQDLLVGAVLAVLVLYFFLGSLRPTLIVALTIPLTLLVTVAVMWCFQLGFNVITMTALALAIGMIVDDAIVVAENIFRHGNRGFAPVEASIQGAAEIAGPDTSGTLTTVAAFLPLVVVTGIAALFLRPFGLTISTALVVSLVLSLTVVPLLFSRSRTAICPPSDFLGARLLAGIDRGLQAILEFAFRHGRWVLAAAVVSLGAAGLAAFLGKVAVLPPIDEGALLIEYVMPPGTSLTECDRIGGILEQIALSNSDVSCIYRRVGAPRDSYSVDAINRGELLIKLAPRMMRARSAQQMIDLLKRAYAHVRGCVIIYHQPTQEKIDESFSGLPALFGVTIYGLDNELLITLAKQYEDILAADPAISNVVNNTKVKASELDVDLDYQQMALHDVGPSDVLATLQAARWGVETTRIVRQKEEIAVVVRIACDGTCSRDTLRRLPIPTSSGGTVPLEEVAKVHIRHTPAAITRLNGQRQITLVAEVEGSIPAVVSRLRRKFTAISLPRGYSVEFTGQYKVLIETAYEMIFAVLCAVILIYFIMTMQFGSWGQPLIILVTIPLALEGGIIALFLTSQGLDVSVGMGAVTLAGIAVNNAIVLIDFANRQVASGSRLDDALRSAASVRLRPILLTTLTTIVALLPTAIGTTVGSRIFQPFSITVIGGLITALLATLIVVPTIVWVFQKSPQART